MFDLCPIYKEKHHPSQVNLHERWYEKNIVIFAQANSSYASSLHLICLSKTVLAYADCHTLTELSWLGKPAGEMLGQLGGWPYRHKRMTWLGRSPF